MKITTAIIPVAGYGTRRLPITKAIEKCMLPIGNRPVVDYVVADCVAAGIHDIYFIVGEESHQIRQYFGRNHKLEKYLRERGKLDELREIQPPQNVNFHFIEQPANGRYGTTIPVALALRKIGVTESVAVIMGDDFLYSQGGRENDITNLLLAAGENEATMLGVRIPRAETAKYGVIALDKRGNFRAIIEKPTPENAPSNLINISKYVFPPKLCKLVLDFASNDAPTHNGEYFITDPINAFVSGGGVMKVVANRGEYLDGGNLAGWLHANEVVGRDLLQ